MSETNLSIAEEIMLLLLHDEDGSFVRLPEWSRRYALSGAVLMELAENRRIDSDVNRLFVIRDEPIGSATADAVLKEIATEKQEKDIRYWVERTAERADDIREEALARLSTKGIIEQVDERFLWVFRSRRYPVIDGTAEKETKLRLFEVLFSDAIPSPRDVILLCLAHASGILNEMLPRKQLDTVSDRIETVRKLDLIGQTVATAIWDIEISIAMST